MLHIIFDNVFGSYIAQVSLVIMFCGLFVQGLTYFMLTRDDLLEFSMFSLYNLEVNQYIVLLLALSNIIGFLSIFFPVLAFYYMFKGKARTSWKTLYGLFFISSLTLIYGAVLLFVINTAEKSLENAISLDKVSIEENSTKVRLADFSVALYTTCCAERGLLSEDAFSVEQCDDDDQLFQNQPGESCFRNTKEYSSFLKLGTDETCALLEESVINLNKVTIPNTNIKYSTLMGDSNSVPLVGPDDEPEFGCGAGLPGAFQFGVYLWANQRIYPIALAATLAGILDWGLLVLGIIFLAPGEDSEYVKRMSKDAQSLEKSFKKTNFESTNSYTFADLVDDFESDDKEKDIKQMI